MEFRFSIEIKQEGQIKQEPGIFNLVLSAQRHTRRASSWDKGGSSFLRRGPQVIVEAAVRGTAGAHRHFNLSPRLPRFLSFSPPLRLPLGGSTELYSQEALRSGQRRQPLPSSTPLPPTWLWLLGALFQASPECPSFSLQVTNLPSPTHHPLPITFSF